MASILSAKSFSSDGVKRRPAPLTTSAKPGTFDAMTGLPAAMPSTAASPKPSICDDRTTTSVVLRIRSTSDRIPRNFTRLSTCRSFANFSHSGLRIPSPTKITLYGSGKNCTALITVSWSFSCLNAATIVINLQSSVIARVFLEIGWLSANFWILIPLYIVNTGRLMMMDFSRFSVVAGEIDIIYYPLAELK